MPENKNVGGMWTKKKANGEVFFHVEITENGEKKSYTAWKNSYKQDGDKKPDYQLVIDTWKPGQQADPVAQVAKTFGDDLPNF